MMHNASPVPVDGEEIRVKARCQCRDGDASCTLDARTVVKTGNI